MIIKQPSMNPQSMTLARRGHGARRDATPHVSQPAASAGEPKTAPRRTLGKALESASRTAKALGDMPATRLGDARKDSARQKVAQIRQQIDMLRKIIMLLGDKASKHLLRRLQELARALAEAASVLKEGGLQGLSSIGTSDALIHGETGAPPSATARDTARDGTDGEASTADADSGTKQPEAGFVARAGSKPADPDPTRKEERNENADTGSEQLIRALASAPDNRLEAERRADAELINEALRELKALVAMAQATRRKDRDSDKQLKDINRQLRRIENAAQALNMPSPAMPAAVGISVKA